MFDGDAARYFLVVEEWQNRNPLRAWRLARNFSIRATGAMLGVSHNSVLDWEHGLAYPNEASFAKIAKLTSLSNIEAVWAAWRAERPQP